MGWNKATCFIHLSLIPTSPRYRLLSWFYTSRNRLIGVEDLFKNVYLKWTQLEFKQFHWTPRAMLLSDHYPALQGNVVRYTKYVKIKFCIISKEGLSSSTGREMQNLHGKGSEFLGKQTYYWSKWNTSDSPQTAILDTYIYCSTIIHS